MPPDSRHRRRVCFVTGTRAEFGLMRRALAAVDAHPSLRLQLIITGMHLDRRRGFSLAGLRKEGWLRDRQHEIVPWRAGGSSAGLASATGRAVAGVADALELMQSEIVLVVGDRVEAFAGAAAGHIGGRVVAHVHGGDRALGQVDDSLRHAITKLAHVHFPATAQSAARIRRLGEDGWRIHRVGSPGIDGIVREAASPAAVRQLLPTEAKPPLALVVLHPTEADEAAEHRRANTVLAALAGGGVGHSVIVYPNNDPGAGGIIRCWERNTHANLHTVVRDLPRKMFLGLLRDTAVLVGNSSSGIIEAASFGTPVIDLGERQAGRERGRNVVNLPFDVAAIGRRLQQICNRRTPLRYPRKNLYGGSGTGKKIAQVLAALPMEQRLLRKLISY